ncbi:MAG: hypothetical protein ABSH56_05755 [Bryobacteraceae bacterium]
MSRQVQEPRPPVHFRASVTLVEQAFNLIFVQDETGAARVDLPLDHGVIQYGNLVEVVGVATEGASAPTVAATKISLLPGERLPRPATVPVSAILSGAAGFRYVQIEGVFRSSFINRARSGNRAPSMSSSASPLTIRPPIASAFVAS